jgi:hypothetical protein
MIYYKVKKKAFIKTVRWKQAGQCLGGVAAVAFSHSCQQPTEPQLIWAFKYSQQEPELIVPVWTER